MKDTGGSAFPGTWYQLNDAGCEQIGEHTFRAPGMTLRDYFAAHAPQMPSFAMPRGREVTTSDVVNAMAAWSYRYADAMIKARDAA